MKNKIIYILTAIVFVVLIGNTIRLKYQNDKLNKDIVITKQDADLKVGRAETITIDAKTKLSLLDKQIQDDIVKQKALVDMYADLQAKYSVKSSGTITVTIPGPTKKIYITKDGKSLELHNLPFVYDDFRLHVNGDAVTHDFKYTLNQNFEVQLAETKLKTGGTNHYAELYELDSNGKRLGKLELTKFQVLKSSDIEEAKFRFWDPRLDLGMSYNLYKSFAHDFSADLGISCMSYGKSSGLTWRFMRLFGSLSANNLSVGFTPVMYNIADPLPIVNNIWLGPSIRKSFDTSTYSLGLSISATL